MRRVLPSGGSLNGRVQVREVRGLEDSPAGESWLAGASMLAGAGLGSAAHEVVSSGLGSASSSAVGAQWLTSPSRPAARKHSAAGSPPVDPPTPGVHSPTARKLSARQAASLRNPFAARDDIAAAGRRLLLPRGRRQRLAAVTGLAALLLLGLFMQQQHQQQQGRARAGGHTAVSATAAWPTHVAALQSEVEHRHPQPRQQLQQQQQHEAAFAASTLTSPDDTYVEFTAPGLYLPLTQAFRLDLPAQQAELPLLQSPMDAAGAEGAGGSLRPRPTLQELQAIQQWGKAHVDQPPTAAGTPASQAQRQQAAAAAGGTTPAGGSSSGARHSSAGEGGGGTTTDAAGTAAGTAAAAAAAQKEDPAQVANELQGLLQLIEADMAAAARAAADAGKPKQGDMGMQDSRRLLATRGTSAGAGQAAQAGTAPDPATDVPLLESGASPGSGKGSSIRLLVAVTSACCSETALRRRAAIRATWGAALLPSAKHVASSEGTTAAGGLMGSSGSSGSSGSVPGGHAAVPALPPGVSVDLRFFLAQPADAEEARRWMPVVQAEVAAYNDTVVVRGPDTYKNLPNKTLRTLRFSLAHPAGYTHVLKTDDDCFVRLHKVLEALHTPRHGTPAAGQAAVPSAKAGAAGAAGAAAVGGSAGTGAGAQQQRLQAQVAAWARRQGKPLHTDGLVVYNAEGMIQQAGRLADRRYIDDADGRAMSLAQLARDTQRLNASGASPGAAGTGAAAAAGSAGPAAAGAAAGAGSASRALQAGSAGWGQPRMTGVYLGSVENKGGFFPIRDPGSKWYINYDELPDSAVPFGVKYLAGWGYVLSRDLISHALARVNLYQQRPAEAPAWFGSLHWEDVMIGLLLMDAVDEPQDDLDTAVRHLDVDAPRLVAGLWEQQCSGLWDLKPVQCSTGNFIPGDYVGWKRWRDSLSSVEHI